MIIHGIFNKRGYGKEYFMNNEIKEILKILKKCEFGACITKHNSRVLLDYITNLQERIDKAIEYIQREFCQVNKETKEIECWHKRVEPILDILQGEDNE